MWMTYLPVKYVFFALCSFRNQRFNRAKDLAERCVVKEYSDLWLTLFISALNLKMTRTAQGTFQKKLRFPLKVIKHGWIFL